MSTLLYESDLISHPAVMLKLAEFNATEQQLQIEIKKQWPEVSLGPTIEHDGELKGGIAFGVALPLWNRNRAGIASAEGLRDEARQECVDVWRSLVYELHRARGKIEALEEQRDRLRNAESAAKKTWDSVIAAQQLGEVDALAHIEAAQVYYEYRERLIEAESEWMIAKIRAVGEMLAVGKDKMFEPEF